VFVHCELELRQLFDVLDALFLFSHVFNIAFQRNQPPWRNGGVQHLRGDQEKSYP
jgi:hypothetical protein